MDKASVVNGISLVLSRSRRRSLTTELSMNELEFLSVLRVSRQAKMLRQQQTQSPVKSDEAQYESVCCYLSPLCLKQKETKIKHACRPRFTLTLNRSHMNGAAIAGRGKRSVEGWRPFVQWRRRRRLSLASVGYRG